MAVSSIPTAAADAVAPPRRARDNPGALAAFAAAKADVDAMLARLAELSGDHFGLDPKEVNWGGVTGLNNIRTLLRQACDFAFLEGEFDDEGGI